MPRYAAAMQTERQVTPIREWERLARLATAIIVALLVALVVPIPAGTTGLARVLLTFAVTAVIYSVRALVRIMRAGPDTTASLLEGLDDGPHATDIIVVTATLASLAGVALMLVAGQNKASNAQTFEAVLALATVASGWLMVHTAYSIRYAREWFSHRGCIDFNTDDPPQFSDFAYVSFGVGMTFGITDNNLTTARIRRVALWHAMLSYLIGTVVIASSINLVTSLAG